MKKICIVILSLITVLALSGCSSTKSYSYEGITFDLPNSFATSKTGSAGSNSCGYVHVSKDDNTWVEAVIYSPEQYQSIESSLQKNDEWTKEDTTFFLDGSFDKRCRYFAVSPDNYAVKFDFSENLNKDSEEITTVLETVNIKWGSIEQYVTSVTKSSSSTSASSSSSSSNESYKVTDNTELNNAVTDAELIVKSHLKDPDSAQFGIYNKDYVVMNMGKGTHDGYTKYSVKGPVTAKNSYSATTKSEFVVQLESNGKGGYYEISCSID